MIQIFLAFILHLTQTLFESIHTWNIKVSGAAQDSTIGQTVWFALRFEGTCLRALQILRGESGFIKFVTVYKERIFKWLIVSWEGSGVLDSKKVQNLRQIETKTIPTSLVKAAERGGAHFSFFFFNPYQAKLIHKIWVGIKRHGPSQNLELVLAIWCIYLMFNAPVPFILKTLCNSDKFISRLGKYCFVNF